MEYVNTVGLRLDGRRPNEIRQLRAEMSTLASADGSATFEMGNTKVLAAVYGPREASNRAQTDTSKATVRCEYSMAAFSSGERRRRGKSDRRATETSLAIANTLEQNILTELLPRTQIDIYVQVLQADGGMRCAAINAAFLALADAGVPMRDSVAACAAGYLDGTALLDLNYTEDGGGGPEVAVALQTGLHQVLMLQTDSKLSMEVFEEVVELASNGCRAVAEFLRTTLLAHVGRLSLATSIAKSEA
ncbi:Exosome complex component RRP41 [Auxenochlorella protothecoides]|uniref:Exosome complex component RRP41 n=2 Tax=Auxenochlorella protothecoides TaxID=3075 RepID=A0A087SQ78_AUXPR|nr:Exosome complex component RRP41 [Auxenochlorella protothecoides]KFM27882.1 Exosome complex component RRP41 [Auxenochlorella protothecoides]RMZ54653.1 hypothetical protein APUTEX25_003031 [Auxenochlorella protothecoides]|eukprot:RMZ54653.1 hypothetical protein APUTEX25_003031 [Auxenochlorella protothecoides]